MTKLDEAADTLRDAANTLAICFETLCQVSSDKLLADGAYEEAKLAYEKASTDVVKSAVYNHAAAPDGAYAFVTRTGPSFL